MTLTTTGGNFTNVTGTNTFIGGDHRHRACSVTAQAQAAR